MRPYDACRRCAHYYAEHIHFTWRTNCSHAGCWCTRFKAHRRWHF